MGEIQQQQLKPIGSSDAIRYFHYLIEEGFRLSYLNSGDLEGIQYQLVKLLTDRFTLYTGGQSSSVPVDKGQNIQQSVFYTIGYYLKSLHDPFLCFDVLKKDTLSTLYSSGKDLLKDDLIRTKELLHSIQSSRFKTDVLAYNDTIGEGLSLFFTLYDIDFGAHESPGSIDYPLSNDKMNLTGIDYMDGYLKKLQLENEFCNLFPQDELQFLMRGYDPQYKELLFNIFDLILNNAIGCVLLGREELHLDITDYDRNYLQKEFAALTREETDKLVEDALFRLCGMLSIMNPKLIKYLAFSAVKLKVRLNNALKYESLHHLFLSMGYETEGTIHFNDKQMLDNDTFRQFADEIRECQLISDKLVLFKRAPLSFTDLIDLLEGDCFFDNEFFDVFQTLEELQIALLVKKLPADPVDASFLDDDSEKEWHRCFKTFLNRIEPERKAAIFQLAKQIEIA